MIIINLIYNLSILVSLNVFSGFINSKFSRNTLQGKIFQGILFSIVAIIGMAYPFVLAEGIIFDGRSIIISLCTLFFGPVTGLIASVASIAFRIYLGGSGVLTGSLVIVTSFLLGYIFHTLEEHNKLNFSNLNLYLFGLLTSSVMMIAMLTLPSAYIIHVYKMITFSVMIFYPLITLISGKIMLDDREKREYVKQINHEKTLYYTTLYSIGDGVISTDKKGNIVTINTTAEKLTGWTEAEALSKPLNEIFIIINEFSRQRVEDPVTMVLREGRKVGLANHTLLISKDGQEIPIADSGAPIKDEKGIITGVVLVFQDQTEAKKNELENLKIQEALKESERKFRSLIENSGDAFYLLFNEKFEMINTRFTELTGYTLEEIQHEDFNFWQLIAPQSRRFLNDRFEKWRMAKEIQSVFEISAVTKDGREIECEISESNIEYKGGIAVQGTIREITERKEAEKALREITQNLNATLNATADGILAVGTNRQVLFFNHRFAELWNIPPYILNIRDDQSLIKFVTDQLCDPELFSKEVERLYSSDQNSFDTLQFNDGRVFERYSFPLRNDLSLQLGRVWSFRDVTERKLAEENLLNSERNFRLLFKNSPLGIYIALPDGAIVDANQALLDILGSPSFEVTKEINVLTFPPLVENGYADKFRKCVADGEVIEIELPYKSKWGKNLYISSYLVPLKDLDGNLEKIYALVNDITDRKNLEQKIKESELKFRTIIDFTYDWEYWSGPDDSLIYISPSSERITGYTTDEFYNNPHLIQDIIFPDDWEAWSKSLYAIQSKAIFKCDFRIIAKNKEIKWINHICNAIFSEDGTYLGRRASNRDITERKKTEDSLLKLKKAVHTSGEAIFLTTDEGIFSYVNPAFTQLYGYSSEEVLSKVTPRVLKSGILDQSVYKNFWDTLKSGSEIKGELVNKRKDNSFVHIDGSASPIFDDENKIIGFLGIQRDISERKKSEEALRDSEQKFRNLFQNHSAVKLIIHPETGNIVDANNSAVNFYNWSVDELKRMNIFQINVMPPDEIKCEMLKASSKERTYFEFRHRKADGSIHDVEVYSSNINIGGLEYLHSIVHDITEKKKNESELNSYREHLENLVQERTAELDKLNKDLLLQLQKKRELEQQLHEALSKEKEVNELKTRFIATVSHEFRTPLASLLSSSQMIQRYSGRWTEEKLSEHYSRISSTISYLTRLLDDVLTISRTDREVIKNNPEPVNPEQLLASFFQEIKPILTGKHELIFTNRCEVRKIIIDEKLLRQVIVNLLTNAVKYSPEGGKIELLISCNSQVLDITLSDQGLGIPEDELQYVFEPFYRTKNSIGIQGTGLGLNIVKRSVDIMKGKIHLISEINKGTTFNLKIPISYEQ